MTDIPEFHEDEATPVVTHDRDIVVEDGVLEQDYHFLDYDFAPEPVTARAYFDEPGVVILTGVPAEIAPPVLHYLRYRFDRIERRIASGSTVLWSRT